MDVSITVPAMRSTDVPRFLAFGTPLILWVALVWPVLSRAVTTWTTQEDLHFGFLLPLLAIVFVWRLRGNFDAPAVRRSTAGVVVILIGLAAYLLSEHVRMKSPAGAAAGVLLWGIVISMWGWRVGRLTAFPVALVTLGFMLQQTLIAPLAFTMQFVTAASAAFLVQLIGLPLVREGLVLRGSDFSFVVAEACSGMNSLLALLALAAVWVGFTSGPLRSRAALLASAAPLALSANIIRVVVVVLVATTWGQESALGFFHTFSDLVLFGTAILGLASFGGLLRCQPQFTR